MRVLAAYTDETSELTKEGDISFFQKELEASGFTVFSFSFKAVIFKMKTAKVCVCQHQQLVTFPYIVLFSSSSLVVCWQQTDIVQTQTADISYHISFIRLKEL